MEQVFLVVGLKLCSSFFSSLMPAVLVQRGGGEASAALVSVWDSSWDAAGLVSLAALALPLCFRRFAAFSSAAVRDACVALLLLSLVLSVAPPSSLLLHLLPLLFLAAHLALLLVSQHAAASALRSGQPLSRARLIGTAIAQLLVVLVLLVPAFSSPVVVCAIAMAGCAMTTFGAVDQEETTTNEKQDAAKVENVSATEEKKTSDLLSVSVASALAFLIIAVVGLNGEQILDASFKLSLRSAHLVGRKGPLVVHHLITAFARFVAFKTSSISHVTLIVLWGAAQLLRLTIVGANADISNNLYVVGGLIMLDKYAGSMGEIALETALLLRLPQSSKGIVPAVALLAVLQPIEDLTGYAVKLLVRADAIPFKYGVIVGLIVFTVAIVATQKKSKGKSE